MRCSKRGLDEDHWPLILVDGDNGGNDDVGDGEWSKSKISFAKKTSIEEPLLMSDISF